jgi:hypothetical protein
MNRIPLLLCATIKHKSTMFKIAENYNYNNVSISLTQNCGEITKLLRTPSRTPPILMRNEVWRYMGESEMKSLILAATQTSPTFIKKQVRRYVKVNSLPAVDKLKNHRVDLQSALSEDFPLFNFLYYIVLKR